jgi:HK97 family phage portal protein
MSGLILPESYVRERASARENRSIGNWESWVGTPALSGVQVSPQTAISLTAVFACVNVIASNIASLPFIVYKRDKQGGREPDYDHPVYDLIGTEPNDEVGPFDFWSAIVGQAVLNGNGYAEIERDEDGSPLCLHQMETDLTQLLRGSDRRLYYRTQDVVNGVSSQPRDLLPENVLHIKSLSPNGLVGYNPITLARESVGGFLAAEKTGAAAFGNSSNPTGFIKVPGEVSDPARKNFRESWDRKHQGPYNASRIAFLEDGWEFVPLKVSLADLQYLEMRKFAPQEIARLFGVPPHKIGDLSDATYSNIEEQNLDFAMGTLRLWTERVAGEVNRKLFFRKERRKWYAQHNMNSLMRGNSQAQSDYLTKLFAIGAVSVNDVCQEAGFNPIGKLGDKRFVAANLIQLEDKPDVDPVELPEVSTPGNEPPGIEKDGEIPTEKAPPEVDEESVKAVRHVVLVDLERMVRREVGALRRAVKRPGFAAYATEFYAEHRSFLASNLAPSIVALSKVSRFPYDPEAVARTIAEASLAQIANDPEPDKVLDAWETSKAARILENLQ